MDSLTILGGKGFVGGAYVREYYDAAIGNISSVNERGDFNTYSNSVLYFISTVDNYNVLSNPTIDINTNLLTLMSALENWRLFQGEQKDGVFNFISSWFVYGNQEQPHGVQEDAVCDPRGFYSITKRCAEQLIISYCDIFNLKYRILRLANVIGPGDKKVSAKKNALQYIASRIEENLDVEVYDDGHFYRDYIHVDDCVRAIHTVLENGGTNEIFNIGNGKTWDFITIVSYLKVMAQSKSQITHIKTKEFHKKVQIPSFYMDVRKVLELGYSPNYTYGKLYNTLLRGEA